MCWKLTPVTALAPTLGFTNCSSDLTLSAYSLTFISKRGLKPSTGEQKGGLAVPNFEVDAIFTSDGITEEAVQAGLWDKAYFEIFLVNYKTLSMGELVLQAGYTGLISQMGPMFRAEGLGLTQAVTQQIVELTLPTCRARELGDSRCQKNLAAFTHTGTITAVTDRQNFTVSVSQATGYFDNGKFTFNDGPNANLSKEIKQNTTTAIQLMESFPFLPVVGNSVTLKAGCDRKASTCEIKFNNKINFQGEDTVPGLEKIHSRTDS
jgi:uncharacterized phage protein (TIGR02218 family)